ncbi:MAG: ATP-binding cassette domain-containing protein, partial [Candidatus Acidiferrales bacterium]
MSTSLDVRGLTVELPTPSGWVRPVNDVSFTLARGETLGIVGESGSGKTMLSVALMGREPHGGRRQGDA